MRIKQLELLGFKSFLDKTKFEFNVPITTIVGPNGCGKSNVVDAIKWITGELSFKELRGRSMEDLIFAGSDKRPPTSMMEVILTLDNEQRNAPAQFNEFSEITLQRRIFRDGSSEFYINKVPCRLRDIIDLFLDTGIGQSSYSIIEQGKVGLIVSGRPEDRRLMIEEAAGITKYKSRKKAAERKIEYTKQNLLRVTDIIQELKKQISSLERQAKRAEEYRKAQGRAQEIDLVLTGREYRDLQTWAKDASLSETKQQDFLSNEETRLSHEESIYETKRLELDTLEKEFQTSQHDLFGIKSTIQHITSQIESNQRDLQRLQESIAQEKTKDGSLDQEITRTLQKIQDTQKQIQLLEEENSRSQQTLDQKQSICLQHKTIVTDIESQIENVKTIHLDVVAKEAQLDSMISSNMDQKATLEEEIVQLQNLKNEISQNIIEQNTIYSQRKQSLDHASQLSFTFEENQKITRGKIEQLELKKTELEKEISDIQKRYDSQSSKLHALQEFARTYQGYTKSVQGIMKNRQNLGNIHGVLGEIIKPQKGFERAIQASLSELIECIVVEGAGDAAKVASYLKNDQKSRGLFVTADSSRKGDSHRIKHEKILGSLSDFVEIQNASKPAVRSLLNNIFVVQGSFEDLFAIWKKNPDGDFVNLEGDFISSNGVIHSGPWSEARGDLEVRQQIDELQAELHPLRATKDELHMQLSQLLKSLSQAKHHLQGIHTDIEKQSKINLDLSRESEKLLGAIEILQHKSNDANARIEKLSQMVSTIQTTIETIQDQKNGNTTRKNQLQENIAGLTSKLNASRNEYQRYVDEFNEYHIRIASSFERAEGLRRDHESSLGLHQFAKDEKDRNHQLIEKHQNEIAQLHIQLQQNTEAKDKAIVQFQAKEVSNSGLQSKHDEAVEQIRGIENQIKAAHMKKEGAMSALSEIRMKISEYSLRMQNHQLHIQEKYSVDLLDYITQNNLTVTQELQDEYKQELEELKGKIQKFGNVNLAAIEEVDQLRERFEFLTNQKDDLEKSLQALIEAIRKINRTTREKFETTFNEVNERFQKIFPRLFRGGKAKLTLTDPENILETGVDIYAQPPGKKLQNMNLLSGGEKALTAISLLFAIFEYKAPPFCVLDEVDAPLDDANVMRFVSIVKEMSHKTQFIVITHNKSTMEMAHNLYGVTMEEPGLSRVVSVRLHQDTVAENIEPMLEARSVA